jgi:hypothetical protein
VYPENRLTLVVHPMTRKELYLCDSCISDIDYVKHIPAYEKTNINRERIKDPLPRPVPFADQTPPPARPDALDFDPRIT